MSYEAEEIEDTSRIIAWLHERGVEAKPYRAVDQAGKRPDLSLHRSGALIGHCEVKSFGVGPSDWSNAHELEGLVVFASSSISKPQEDRGPTPEGPKVRLSNVITDAAKQLAAADPERRLLWMVAIANRDLFAERFDLAGVLRGEEYLDGVKVYDERDNPNRRISADRLRFDLVLWMDKHGALIFQNDDPSRVDLIEGSGLVSQGR